MSKNFNKSQDSNKFSKELISYINNNEIGWEPGLFQKFKDYQEKKGIQKQKYKQWNFSNNVKRNKYNDENRIRKQNNIELNFSNGVKRNNGGAYFRAQNKK